MRVARRPVVSPETSARKRCSVEGARGMKRVDNRQERGGGVNRQILLIDQGGQENPAKIEFARGIRGGVDAFENERLPSFG